MRATMALCVGRGRRDPERDGSAAPVLQRNADERTGDGRDVEPRVGHDGPQDHLGVGPGRPVLVVAVAAVGVQVAERGRRGRVGAAVGTRRRRARRKADRPRSTTTGRDRSSPRTAGWRRIRAPAPRRRGGRRRSRSARARRASCRRCSARRRVRSLPRSGRRSRRTPPSSSRRDRCRTARPGASPAGRRSARTPSRTGCRSGTPSGPCRRCRSSSRRQADPAPLAGAVGPELVASVRKRRPRDRSPSSTMSP